jgi:hypothetical protein
VSAPLRFLGLAILAYVGLRTASSALALQPIPGGPAAAAAAASDRALAANTLPPGVPADMGPVAPGAGAPPIPYPYGPAPYPYALAGGAYAPAGVPMPYAMVPAAMPTMRPQPFYYPVPYPVSAPAAPAAAAVTDLALGAGNLVVGQGYAQPAPPLEAWPAIGTAGPFSLGVQTSPPWSKQDGAAEPSLAAAVPQRWSVDAWAMLRPPREGAYALNDPGGGLNPGLASAGSLGGSQAGMRITWRPLSSIGVHLRASSALMPQGRSARSQALAGGEGSLGVSWQPLKALPVRLLAERRQRLGPALGGGRNAFALLAEGGVYERPLPLGFTLDGYAQAGAIGARRRDLFADGGFAATYPFMPKFAIGAGMWGGVQPGLSRLDAGPRLSYQLRPGLRTHLDYRFRLTGNADPVNGPALTLAAGF